jgi:hypothetical protein
MADDKREWMKAALGIDIPEPSAGAPRAKRMKDGVPDGDQVPPPQDVQAKPPEAPPQGQAVADPEVAAALKALADEAAALKKLGFDTTQMMADHADFTKSAGNASKLPDEGARTKALAAIKKRVNEAVEHAKALSASCKSVMGDSKDNPSDAQKSAIYKKALEDLYSLKIKVPAGMANTHFDKVFDMFGTLPKDQAKNAQMKKLTYSNKASDAGGGAFGSTEIEMGDFGDAKGSETYEIDGVKIPANSFNVTTLHEIGHSVDEDKGVMSSNQSKAGCGGWKSETIASITTVYLDELKKTAKPSAAVTDPMLKGAITNALASGDTTQPDAIGDDDWQKIVVFLTDSCLPIRSDADPWFAPSQVVIGGRVYQEAYDGEWWSYDNGARGTTKVNDYQWRSPAEWFAEVYAISWLAKKKPPAGVDAAIVAYAWQG